MTHDEMVAEWKKDPDFRREYDALKDDADLGWAEEAELERQHREGYLRNPGEPSDWEDEQVWVD